MTSQWKMDFTELLTATKGKSIAMLAQEFNGVGTDSRTDLKGKIFIPLKGENFDAHDFIPQAIQNGAAAILVHRSNPEIAKYAGQVSVIEVADTLTALQDLAHFWRHKMSALILGITGTNGKTTCKEFAAQIIGTKKKVHYSKGSFNNHWGVPLTLLALEPFHEVAVVEMGMNHPGELTTLAHIADADAVVCTMVGRGHLEGLGSLEAVARAKSEIYNESPESAVRIFNLENSFTAQMYEKWKGKVKTLTFDGRKSGEGKSVDVALAVIGSSAESLTIRGSINGVVGSETVPVFGEHNVTNLMAASALALAAGLSAEDIWKALPNCRGTWGRNQWLHLESGAKVLFDGYNANPESMRAAVVGFSKLAAPPSPGRKIGIFADMRELGRESAPAHEELGQLVARSGFDWVWYIGQFGVDFKRGLEGEGYNKKLVISGRYEENLAAEVRPVLSDNDLLLIKGSRGMELERVLLAFKPKDFKSK